MALKKTVRWLLVLDVILFALILGLKQKLNLARIQHLQYPAVLPGYSTIGLYPDWVLRQIQPVLVGFAVENYRNYLKVEYPNADGGRIDKKVFVTGQVGEGKEIDNIFLEGKDARVETLDFSELKHRLKANRQIGIEYMANVPEDDGLQAEICLWLKNYCLLRELMNSAKTGFAGNDDIIYAVKIYLNLQNE